MENDCFRCQNCKASFEDPHNTLNYCLGCNTITCYPCFQSIHSSELMKLHGEPVDISKKPKSCERHPLSKMELVCTECKILLCMECAALDHECPRIRIMKKSSFYELAKKTVTALVPKLKELQKSYEEFHEEAANNVKAVFALKDSVDDEIEKILSDKRQSMKRDADEYYTKELQKYTKMEGTISRYNIRNLEGIKKAESMTENEFPLNIIGEITASINILDSAFKEMKEDSTSVAPKPFEFSPIVERNLPHQVGDSPYIMIMSIFQEADALLGLNRDQNYILGEYFFSPTGVRLFLIASKAPTVYRVINDSGNIELFKFTGKSYNGESISSVKNFRGEMSHCEIGEHEFMIKLLLITPLDERIYQDTRYPSNSGTEFLLRKAGNVNDHVLNIYVPSGMSSFALVGDKRQHFMAYNKQSYRIYNDYAFRAKGQQFPNIIWEWKVRPDIIACYKEYIFAYDNSDMMLEILDYQGNPITKIRLLDKANQRIHGNLISMKIATESRMLYCIFTVTDLVLALDVKHIYRGVLPPFLH